MFSHASTLPNMPRVFSKCMQDYASVAARDNRKSTVSQSQSKLRIRIQIQIQLVDSRIPRSTNAFPNAPLCVDFCDEQIYDSYQIQLPSRSLSLYLAPSSTSVHNWSAMIMMMPDAWCLGLVQAEIVWVADRFPSLHPYCCRCHHCKHEQWSWRWCYKWWRTRTDDEQSPSLNWSTGFTAIALELHLNSESNSSHCIEPKRTQPVHSIE